MMKINVHAEKLVAVSEADACDGLLATADVPAGRRLGRLRDVLAAAGKYQPGAAIPLHLHHRELHLAGSDYLHAAPRKAAVP